MKKLILAVLSFLLFLSSCSTMSREIPDWVISQPRIIGSVVFIGQGSGSTRNEARTDAYDDVLQKMSSGLGRDLSSLYLRELMSKHSIDDLSTTVEGEYSSSDGSAWTFYVLTVTPNRSFRDSRSPEYIELLYRESRIESMINESLSLYSENKDIDAIDRIIDAIGISLEGDVNNPDYTAAALRDRAIEYISRLRIRTSRAGNDKGEVTVTVRRARGILHPAVIDGYICSRYQAVNTDGDVVSCEFISKTGKNGSFLFNRTDPYMLRSSSYEFSPYIDNEKLLRIADSTEPGFLDPLYSAIESVSEEYSFSEGSRIDDRRYIAAISVYDISGNQIESSIIEEPMRKQLAAAGLEGFASVNGYGEVSDDTYELLSHLYPDKEYFFILRAGIVDRATGIEKTYVRADAIFTLYDSHGSILKTQDYYTSGSGTDLDEAIAEAFTRIARLTSGFLLEEL